MRNEINNNVPVNDKDNSSLEFFSGTKITPHLHHFYHLGCPTYLLNGKIQQGQKIRKWQDQA
jgi:hypothetical protein